MLFEVHFINFRMFNIIYLYFILYVPVDPIPHSASQSKTFISMDVIRE